MHSVFACRPVGRRFTLTALALAAFAPAAGATVASIKPQYLPPAEVLDFLGAHEQGGVYVVSLSAGHDVQIRLQDTANLMLLQGESADVQAVQDLVRAADVAPRQIMLDAQIVEINEGKARDAGFDWNVSANGTAFWARRQDGQKGVPQSSEIRRGYQITGSAAMHAVLGLESAGAARTHTIPRIVTLNNRRATILDGSRAVYVAQFGSFTSLFKTDSLDAGVTLSVLPSIGESGYVRLVVRAEMTTLSRYETSLSKYGQMIENELIAKNDEPVLLGGFDSEETSHHRSGLPILGKALPFLFSRNNDYHSHTRTYLILTPHVVDLASTVDGATQKVLDGK